MLAHQACREAGRGFRERKCRHWLLHVPCSIAHSVARPAPKPPMDGKEPSKSGCHEATLRSLFTSFTHSPGGLDAAVGQDKVGCRGARVRGFCIEWGLGRGWLAGLRYVRDIGGEGGEGWKFTCWFLVVGPQRA